LQKEEFIETIVKEVLKKLNDQSDSSKEKFEKEKILLSQKADFQFAQSLREKYELIELEAENEVADFAAVENLVITQLDLKGLIELSELIQVEAQLEFIVKFLFEGKNIYIIEEGLSYRNYHGNVPQALYDKLIKAEEKLKSYGFVFLGLNQLAAELEIKKESKNSTPNHLETKTKSEYFRLDKKLIDLSIIQKLYQKNHSKFEISQSSIVTALAKDYIKDQKIEIEYIEGR
jgi:ethanolamine utilization protein